MGEPTNNAARTAQLTPVQLEDYSRRFSTALKHYFHRRGCQPATVDDLVQDVFVRLARRMDGTEIENPEAYLMQTASSVWMDHLRKKQRRGEDTHIEYEDETHSPEGFSPERVLEGREAVNQLAEALKALPGRTRRVYLLCKIDGMKRRDVAKKLGLSVSSVDKELMSATKHLTAIFGDWQ